MSAINDRYTYVVWIWINLQTQTLRTWPELRWRLAHHAYHRLCSVLLCMPPFMWLNASGEEFGFGVARTRPMRRRIVRSHSHIQNNSSARHFKCLHHIQLVVIMLLFSFVRCMRSMLLANCVRRALLLLVMLMPVMPLQFSLFNSGCSRSSACSKFRSKESTCRTQIKRVWC